MEEIVKSLPTLPGVYFFIGKRGEVLYIGKAKNLKSRVSSYFSNKLEAKTQAMVNEADSLDYILVDSDFEASLLEANLVGKKQPRYNIQLKDGKSPLYIGITSEQYPRVVTVRKTQLKSIKLRYCFGPYLNSATVRRVLKVLRRTFRYSTHGPGTRACIYSQIGLCEPCPSAVEKASGAEKQELYKKYMFNVRGVAGTLAGKKKSVILSLERQMKNFSEDQKYEEAKDVRSRLDSFLYVLSQNTAPEAYLEEPNLLEDIRTRELNGLKELIGGYVKIRGLRRIECFDVAHLSGAYPTASMVTFMDGNPDKSYYRHFRIWSYNSRGDTDAMREVLRRRLGHFDDWGKPDLVVVDGGKGQVSVANEVLADCAVIGLAKRRETVVIKKDNRFIQLRPRGEALKLLQRLRDEAHRFARRYHHKLVSKAVSS